MNDQKYLLIIGGPTGSGKTTLSIQLAQHYNTEIISADSRQFYREMSIGTAKPTPAEQAAAKHHFVDCISIHDNFNAGDFEREALTLLDELFKEKDLVILAGGSGLFIRALCEGLDLFPDTDPIIRAELNTLFQEEGISPLQSKLKELDPEYYKTVDLNNPQRLIRALEVCLSSGKPYSDFRKGGKAERPFKMIYIYLDWDRAQLYDRINSKVDQMLEDGHLEEVRALYPHKNLNALQTVGYQELFDYFDKKTSLEEAIELFKRNSRRYAKRQLTWFRKDEHWKKFHPSQVEEIIEYINQQLID